MTWTETAKTVEYEIVDGRCFFMAKLTGTVGGVPADQILVTLPINSARTGGAIPCGYETGGGSRFACVGFINAAGNIRIVNTGSLAFVAGAGQILYASGDYEIA
jgi:hypothetical protein